MDGAVAHRQGDGSVWLGGHAVHLGVGGVVVLGLQDELLALALLPGHGEGLPWNPGTERRGVSIKWMEAGIIDYRIAQLPKGNSSEANR